MAFVNYTYEELVAHRAAGVPAEALERLRADAEKTLAKPFMKATERKMKAPSGDPHDYVSMGPYWWPNPDTPDGLPYINRDCQVNPETQEERGGEVYARVYTMALAAFYLGDTDGKYSDYAKRQIDYWFINPETKMNPNGKYAQRIPGRCDGRGVGLIDFSGAHQLFNGLTIFEGLGLLDAECYEGVRAWYNEFINWMLTHEYGFDADNGGNNHGCWYDSHVLSAAVWLDRPELARKILTTSYVRRNVGQIREDGSLPRELARVGAMGYTFYALDALYNIANIAERHGYAEYWGIDKKRGHCILRQAIDFIYPYFLNPESFTYQKLDPEKMSYGRIYPFMMSIDKRYPDAGYAERAQKFINPSDRAMLIPTR